MKKNLHLLLFMLAALVGMNALAVAPSSYYNSAKNKSDKALMTALHQIIKGHTKRTYQQLWTYFQTTDCNGNTIIDRYSSSQFTYSSDQCGTYSAVGDCYNREHSIPNSWWGGLESDTAYTDLHHMFPVDGYVNNKRGNYPFGDCNNGTVYGTGKLGTCTFSGYNATVFEVADEYKGDFARVYFYFATRYMMRIDSFTSSMGSAVFSTSSYLGMTTWAINQMLEWHRNDPVSSLETARNDAVYSIQGNRNPYIDNPELVEYIWGNMKGNVWSGSGGTTTPVLTAPANGSTINVGTNTGSGVSKAITVSGTNLTKALTVSVSGTGFSVTPTTISAANANAGTTVTVTYNGTAASATGTLTITSSEVSSTVTLTANYNSGGGGGETGDETIETWEGCSGYGSYSTTFIQGHAFAWNTNDVGIWTGDSHCNDALSVRFGKTSSSYIEMAEDVSNGASKVTFYAATWSASESAPTLQVLYSTNSGSSWTAIGTCSPTTTWQQFSFSLNVTGNVRFKIKQTAGARLNVDDIAITSNPSTPVINPVITITPPAAIEVLQGEQSPIVSGVVTAIENGLPITLSVGGNFQLSLNRTNWSRSLTLDSTGETFYMRLSDTGTVGEYYGSITATTGVVSAYADVQGVVTAKPVTRGDVNMDGSVDINDVTTLIDYLLSGNIVIDTEAADLDDDNRIAIDDVTALIDLLLTGPAKNLMWLATPADGGIFIENPTDELLEIYDMDAVCLKTVKGHGNYSVDLPAGIYIVSGDTRSGKVVVK